VTGATDIAWFAPRPQISGFFRASSCHHCSLSILDYHESYGRNLRRMTRDPYEILQLAHHAEPEVIEAAYKRLALKYHPDQNSSANATGHMQDLNWAYQILMDPAKRANYDRGVSPKAPQKPRPPPPKSNPKPPPKAHTYTSTRKASVRPHEPKAQRTNNRLVVSNALGAIAIGILLLTMAIAVIRATTNNQPPLVRAAGIPISTAAAISTSTTAPSNSEADQFANYHDELAGWTIRIKGIGELQMAGEDDPAQANAKYIEARGELAKLNVSSPLLLSIHLGFLEYLNMILVANDPLTWDPPDAQESDRRYENAVNHFERVVAEYVNHGASLGFDVESAICAGDPRSAGCGPCYSGALSEVLAATPEC